jgi:hypothetical protein
MQASSQERNARRRPPEDLANCTDCRWSRTAACLMIVVLYFFLRGVNTWLHLTSTYSSR